MSDRSVIPHDVPATRAVQIAFCTVLPRISRHARFYFRYLKRKPDHEDAVAEAVALAWKWFARLVQQGKHPDEFVSAIATYAVRAVKSGRRLCGQERAKDVLSRRAQARLGFFVSAFSDFSTLTGNALDEALHDNAVTPVPDQVSFRIDFPAWMATRSLRDRKLIARLITGDRFSRVDGHALAPGPQTDRSSDHGREVPGSCTSIRNQPVANRTTPS